MWAWVYCSWKTELLFPGMKGTNISSDPSWLANVCLVIVAFVVTPLLARRMTAKGRRVLLAASTAAMVVGVCGSAAFAGSTGAMVAGSYASGVLTGFGSGVLLTFVGAQYTNLTVGELETAVLLNLLFTPAASMAASMLVGTELGVLFVAMLPLAAGLLLLASPDVDPDASSTDTQLDIYRKPPRRDILTMGVVVMLFHVATAIRLSTIRSESLPAPFESLAGFFQTSMALASVATLLVCFVVMAYSRRIDFSNICRISIPTYLLGIVLLPLGAVPFAGVASQALIAFSGTYFSLIVYIVFIKLAKIRAIPVYCAVAGFMAPYEVGVLAGNLLTVATMEVPDVSLRLSVQVALIVGILAVALLVAPLWNRPVPGSRQWREDVPASLGLCSESEGAVSAFAPFEVGAPSIAGTDGLRDATDATPRKAAASGKGGAAAIAGDLAADGQNAMPRAVAVSGSKPCDALVSGSASCDAGAASGSGAASAAASSDSGVTGAAAGEEFETVAPMLSKAPLSSAQLTGGATPSAATFAQSLQAIAARGGLTSREAEICGLLAQGRSRPYIRELLCVSKNTVDTHVRHAYAKLGIHSNQELIDLLQAEMTRNA